MEKLKKELILLKQIIVKKVGNKDTLNAFLSYPNKLDITELKKYLLKNLPNYMMPNTYTVLEKLPITPNGKIDRKTLETYDINTNENEKNISLPRNEIEKIILEVIKKKLNVEDIGIDSNIFDYGADSLTIINMKSL